MSATLQQIYTLNPTTVINDTDLFYVVQSPYTPGTDAGITGASLKAIFGTGGTVNPGLINEVAYYAATGNALSGITTANNGVLITSGAGAPSISSTLPSAVQLNITELGTVTTGIWHATPIDETHGGTDQTSYTLGDTLYASGTNTLSKLSGNITTQIQYLSQVGDGATSAAPIWSTISGGDITGAALTKVDDTNVTLTLGGTPSTALLRAASLTLGWSGELGLTRGGTNASLTANNGGIVWSNATQLQILAGTPTAGKILQSGATASPSWSTPTYPSASGTLGKFLISDGTNNVYSMSTIPTSAGATANKVLLSDGTNYVLSTPTFPNASATSGKIIISDGTNWIASTPTFPNTASTSGKLLRSDGTNFVTSTPTYPTGAPTSGTIMIGDGTNYVESTTTYPSANGWNNFTPTITLVGGAGNTVPTYSSSFARYARVGNVVFIDINLANSSGGTAGAGTGTLNIALPVTAGASSDAAQKPCGWLVNNTQTVMLWAQISPGATTLTLVNQVTVTTVATVTGAGQNNAVRQLQVSLFYEI